ncbi:hypothetical protein [Epilithonimonas vandammei]|uniref:Uncharacterized protein n=1 Tax=Epilithonimonas vandammei TaxID=2487072 RepID=A0A3G8XZB3_9FLAO|nr:hypothetical protein [Epilithonimonas vandammei]AZI38625.1 hypothetical protein EIB74_00985 [Epilithonimonas vandammei]
MKNKKIDFESRFWSGSKTNSRIKLIEKFFQFNDLVTAKELLNQIMIHSGNKKSVIAEDSSAIFHFHQALRSLVRACFLILQKEKRWKVNEPQEGCSPLSQGSLSDGEFVNPVRVFQKAFGEYSIKDFDYYISVAVYFSLGTYTHAAESKIFVPYLHLCKMLDASYLILERGIQKKNIH